ncbi:MAG: polyprenyl synthetase family protein [Acidobacteriota bacterium]
MRSSTTSPPSVQRALDDPRTLQPVGPLREEIGDRPSPSRSAAAPGGDLLARLQQLVADRGLRQLSLRLARLAGFIRDDLVDFERAFTSIAPPNDLAGQAAQHLLDRGGKRLRPLCVLLAAHVGRGVDARVRDLAVAVELVHNATLLHDDVVDDSQVRRGSSTARAVYGNAAAIFAGDWVLIEALRRVHRASIPGLELALFDPIDAMIHAEAEQLASRGQFRTDRAAYFRIIEGKTASVFEWAMRAGGLAGGLSASDVRHLEAYGLHLGVAFQAVDDLLDPTGSRSGIGKALFTDLREGKMTYPLIVALERRPALREVFAQIATASSAPIYGEDDSPVPEDLRQHVLDALDATGAIDACRTLARERAARAIDHLDALPDSRAQRALATIADALVNRDR